MAKVIFDIMRHGDRDGDQLTSKGVGQVRDSAQKNLAGCLYTLAFFSGLVRARQTVETCLAALGHRAVPILVDEGFSYVTAQKEAEPWMGKPFTALKTEGYQVGQNVEFWLKNWAPALIIRGQILATMRLRAQMLATADGQDCRVLVGSHGPTSELGCCEPANTPSLREADMIRYTWEVDQSGATPPRLLSSVVFRAPY